MPVPAEGPRTRHTLTCFLAWDPGGIEHPLPLSGAQRDRGPQEKDL